MGSGCVVRNFTTRKRKDEFESSSSSENGN